MLTTETRTNIFVFSKHYLTAEGIKNIAKPQRFNIHSFSGSIHSVIKILNEKQYDIIIVDDKYVKKDIFLRYIHNIYNAFSYSSRVLVLTSRSETSYLKTIINVGINGIIYKNASKEKILEAIELISQDGVYYDNRISSIYIKTEVEKTSNNESIMKMLSKREREILDLIAIGLKNHEIAERLFIASGTVGVHKANLLKKLNLKTTTELIIFSQSHNKNI